MSYSPGPWWVYHETLVYCGPQPPDILPNPALIVADCYSGRTAQPTDEEIANANLCAAAPELVEACLAMLPYLPSHNGDKPSDSGREAELKARAAIAKAMGQEY